MNEIDDLKADVNWLDNRVLCLEEKGEKKPYFLYGRKGSVRKCIAIFSSEMFCESFIKSCKLKNPRKNQVFKKNTPLFWWDELNIEREYVPDHVLFNPILKDFYEKG